MGQELVTVTNRAVEHSAQTVTAGVQTIHIAEPLLALLDALPLRLQLRSVA